MNHLRQIKINSGLFFNNLKFESELPKKTAKRYSLELNPKKERGSKLCLNNCTKTLPIFRLN